MINSEVAQQKDWHKAATLSERIAALRDHGRNPGVPKDGARAHWKFEKWRAQPPFDTKDYFVRRLATDGITEEELLGLIGEENGSAAPTLWLEELAQAFAAPASPTPFPACDLPYFQESAGFLSLIQCAIDQASERLQAGIRKLEGMRTALPFDPAVDPAMFSAGLAARLLAILNRTMILELNVARLEGHLQGDTSEERFQSFLLRLRDKEIALDLLLEYPVLARQIMIRADQWVACSLELLQSLCSDWADIRTAFFAGNDPGTLVEARGGMGDQHRDGRSVYVCKFSSGLQLLYKPRPMSLDRHFQDLLVWVNGRSDLSFRTLKILDRGDYGWVEFIDPHACKSPDEVERFYKRQGGYLALLFALEASDFHFENVIAAGEHPVLIDLEAMFHPRIETSAQPHANESVSSVLDYSVLRVGLLPQRVFGEDASKEATGIDTSGLGGSGGQLTLGPVPWLAAAGTDTMHIARKRVMMQQRENRPSLPDAEIKVQDHGDAIVAGFTAVYETLLLHREELLSPNGLLAQFADDQVRAVLRPTEVYNLLLRESFHPDLLRDALDRDRFLDYLWAGVQECPPLERVITSERDDLLKGDIPIFTTRPSSCDLWSSAGQHFAKFFSQSGLDRVTLGLRRLSEDDLSRQVWFIRASLTSLMLGEIHPVKKPTRETQGQHDPATPERLTSAATKVGERLKQLALWGKSDVSWVGVGLVHERAWSILPLGNKLYDGLPGVILFLAYLGSVTKKNEYELSARGALATLLRQLKAPPEMTSIGSFSGLGGILYVLCHLSALWNKNGSEDGNEDGLLDEAEKIVEKLPALIAQDDKLDIMAGAAGCIAALLAFYRLRPCERVLSIAIQCGDHLITQAQPMQQGRAWLVSSVASTPLTGFSHGAAGIAWALAELAALTGEERFQRTAMEAIAYERSLFVPELGNWPDLRRDLPPDADANPTHCGMMWCHGAPGIALARLRMLKHLNQQDLRNEAEIALQTILRQGFGMNHCLCHGDLGNLEIILQASLVLDDPMWKNEVGRLAASVLESIEQDGWLCGTPANVETPGLLTGLAGIGFELLRLAEPLRVPSVLCLEPPVLRAELPKGTRLPVIRDVVLSSPTSPISGSAD